jgi:hypothetical protein
MNMLKKKNIKMDRKIKRGKLKKTTKKLNSLYNLHKILNSRTNLHKILKSIENFEFINNLNLY